MTLVYKVLHFFRILLLWLNRVLYVLTMLVFVFLVFSLPKWFETITLSDGTTYTDTFHDGDLEIYNMVAFIPILGLILFSFLEYQNRKLRSYFFIFTFLAFCLWLVYRVWIKDPNYDPNYFSP